jgi:uncharacterized protein YbaR (Trm112 family)
MKDKIMAIKKKLHTQEPEKKPELTVAHNHHVFVVKSSCPICHGDVKGNTYIKYYCKNCNLLFRIEDLEDRNV